MATVHVAFSEGNQQYVPVAAKTPSGSEVITSSATSQATTITANNGEFVTITASGGNVWAKIGSSPTAASADEWLILDGQTRNFGPCAAGDTCAVIDA